MSGESEMFPQNHLHGAVAVLGREHLIHVAVAGNGSVVPAAFGEPKFAAHDQLHGVDVMNPRRGSGKQQAVFRMVRTAHECFADVFYSVSPDGVNDDIDAFPWLMGFGVMDAGLAVDGS